MLAFIQSSPLLLGTALILLDLVIWQLIPLQHRAWRIGTRLVLFVLFSAVLVAAGMSPLQPPPWPDDVARNLMATVLAIGWWLLGARTVTVVFGLLLVARGSHGGRLLQDVLGALIFLAAVVAAAGYVLQLPVKGLLATSGVMAIVIGLALQSTLADVFSGIVLNTTRPYQIGDSIAIDGTEGKVLDIDWRATRLLTGTGSLAVIPNSVAAKARLLNHSRPADVHGVSINVVVPAKVRPRRVFDALEKALHQRDPCVTCAQGVGQGLDTGVGGVRGQRVHCRHERQDCGTQPVVRPGAPPPGGERGDVERRPGHAATQPTARSAGRGAGVPFAKR